MCLLQKKITKKMTVLLLELVVVLVVLALVLVVPQLLLAGLDRGCSDCFQNGPPSRFSQAVFSSGFPLKCVPCEIPHAPRDSRLPRLI